MKKSSLLLPLLALVTLLGTGCATSSLSAPTPLPTNVTVNFQEPDKFTDARSSFGSGTDQAYLDTLSDHIKRKAAARIGPDQKLDVTVTDVDLAGDYLPARAALNDVRIIKDIYRPRITLTFKLTGADGSVIKQGDRTLVDNFFMNNLALADRDQPLFYDKALLTDWIDREFKK